MSKYTIRIFYLLPMLMFFCISCEEGITIDLPEGEEKLVVDGRIEQGAPPVILLSRSVPVFENINLANFQNAFVHHAEVKIKSAGKIYTLQEVASADFSQQLKQVISEQFALPLPLLNHELFKFYVYTSDELMGEIGKSYELQINHEGHTLTSVTTIPQLNPLDSLWWEPHPDPEQDSLVILNYRYSDPDTLGNSIRYFTKRNSEPFYPGLFSSVFNDEIINGADKITFPLDRGEPKGQVEIDAELYSYFGKGDTITVRWCAIDLPHYRFWYTLESEQSSNGSPIGSPNTTRSNINGGLGVWGGYGVTYHSIIIDAK